MSTLHTYVILLTNYAKKNKARKWFYLSIVALQGFLGPLSSSIYVGLQSHFN